MVSLFNVAGMMPVSPKSPFTVFPLIILLTGPPGYQLHGLGNGLWIVVTENQEVDMSGL
jgi:hypothetical protein